MITPNPMTVPLTVEIDPNIPLDVESGTQDIDLDIDEIITVIDADEYEGPYEVESTVTKTQTLETEGLLMTEDVTISPVPIWRTGNVSGITVYIGRTEE